MVSIHTRIKGYENEYGLLPPLRTNGCCFLSDSFLRRSGPVFETSLERRMASNAIERNDLKGLKEATGDMMNIDEPNVCGRTLLMEAVGKGNLKMVKYLKGLNADTKIRDDYGRRVLNYADVTKDSSIIDLLKS